jgi:hypothetical protein
MDLEAMMIKVHNSAGDECASRTRLWYDAMCIDEGVVCTRQ